MLTKRRVIGDEGRRQKISTMAPRPVVAASTTIYFNNSFVLGILGDYTTLKEIL